MSKLWAAIIVAVLVATGCSAGGGTVPQNAAQDQDYDQRQTAANSEQSEFTPTLDIRVETAKHSATVYITTDLKIVEPQSNMKRVPGEGHIHLYVDNGEKVVVAATTYTITDLQPGKHTVTLSLHNNDHTPYNVSKQAEFEIQ